MILSKKKKGRPCGAVLVAMSALLLGGCVAGVSSRGVIGRVGGDAAKAHDYIVNGEAASGVPPAPESTLFEGVLATLAALAAGIGGYKGVGAIARRVYTKEEALPYTPPEVAEIKAAVAAPDAPKA